MSAASGPPAPTPTRLQPWLIAVLALVLACCLCFGLIGLLLAFGGPILQELGLAALPGAASA